MCVCHFEEPPTNANSSSAENSHTSYGQISRWLAELHDKWCAQHYKKRTLQSDAAQSLQLVTFCPTIPAHHQDSLHMVVCSIWVSVSITETQLEGLCMH